MTQTIIHLQRLSSNGVAFHSYTEPLLATDNELVRNILLALLSSLAKVEAQKISERTRAGMSRAKASRSVGRSSPPKCVTRSLGWRQRARRPMRLRKRFA
jgi:DNA invertase Pin-like site-specific DNA recombinase